MRKRPRMLFDSPLRRMLDAALDDFRAALVERKLYDSRDNLERACRGARDFVDFLVEGPGVLRKWRQRER